MIQEGSSESDIKAAILADEKKYTSDEIEEIYAKLSEGETVDSSSGEGVTDDSGSDEVPKEGKYIVTSPFNDASSADKNYRIGDDISHFDQKRLDLIVERGLAKIV